MNVRIKIFYTTSLLFLLKVPCELDQVILGEKSTVTVNVPNDVTVNRITLAGQVYQL